MNLTIQRSSKQRGLSLIEVMVAMVIGSFLILGITQIFISNQKSYLFQQGQAGNQENGRFTLAILSQELSKAGYRSNPTNQEYTFPNPSSGTVSGCNFVSGAGASVTAISATSLCIQYQVSNLASVTCQGTALSAADKAIIIKPYTQLTSIAPSAVVVVERIDFDPLTNSVTCTIGATTQQLVTGVADIRFDYGSGSTETETITEFGPTSTQTVRAIRYSALMQSISPAAVRDTSDTPKVLADWNTRYAGTVIDKTKIYQIVQGTVMLRNLMK
ncbi:MAG: pilW [Pseudomonas sp.]|uniref:PilW family protein n=1 Tax=Pseudomonas sp. TaxID=306 RepID=UPI00260A5CBC|nr:PilW family protein [Pseudomonas sp.]MDB6050985.1 pilW [Pseudomonas sp.]